MSIQLWGKMKKILSPQESKLLAEHRSIMGAVYEKLSKVHKRPLHEGQIKVAKAYFNEGKKVIQSQWGRSGGKALALDTPILTPSGWKCMGDLRPGDCVFGDDGKPTKVTAVSPVMYDHICYDVVFSDGSIITADADHLWETFSKLTRRSIKKNKGKLLKRSPIKGPSVVTTQQIKDTLLHGKEANHTVKLARPIYFEPKKLPVDPYVLGVWLGDGNSKNAAFYSADMEIVRELERRGYPTVKSKDKYRYGIKNLTPGLKTLDLFGNKHIPELYLLSSEEQRLELLRGLLDTDGYCDERGRVEFCNTNKQITDGVKFLAESLGMKCTLTSKIPKCQSNKACARAYLVHIVTNQQVFLLSRKQARIKKDKCRSAGHRFIWEVRERESVPVRCIMVDNQSHLFLAGKSLIPTHNSEVVCYIAWVQALLYPNSQIYIICPQRKQGKEIYWSSNRLPNYGPEKYVDAFLDSELRIRFKNNSFICIDGCENKDSHRGIKPTLVFYDEFQHHTEGFHVEVMQPNLLAKQSALIVTGTPPPRECYYTKFKEKVLEAMKTGDESRMYFEFPTSVNPSIDPVELKKTIDSLMQSGNGDIARREYLGEDCFGGAGVVFPYWDRKRLTLSHDDATNAISRDKTKLKWIAFADPGNNTCFAVLFCAYNPNTSQIFVLDEIYEKDRRLTEPLAIWSRIKAKQRALFDGKWINGYDSAAAWWETLIRGNFGESLHPSAKHMRDIDVDVALMKSMMKADDIMYVSRRCENFIKEVENFVTDDKGDYPDFDDHLLDCFRYTLRHFNFKYVEKGEREGDAENTRLYTANGIVINNKIDWTEAAVQASYNDNFDYDLWN